MTNDHTRDDLLLLLQRVDEAINAHRDPDPRETERLCRWRRELLLQFRDLDRSCWGD